MLRVISLFLVLGGLLGGFRVEACALQVSENPFFESIRSATHLPQFVRDELEQTATALAKRSEAQFAQFKETVSNLLTTGAQAEVLRASFVKSLAMLPEQNRSLADHFLKQIDSYLPNPLYRGAAYNVAASLAVFCFTSLRDNKHYADRFFEESVCYLSAETDESHWEYQVQKILGQITHR